MLAGGMSSGGEGFCHIGLYAACQAFFPTCDLFTFCTAFLPGRVVEWDESKIKEGK